MVNFRSTAFTPNMESVNHLVKMETELPAEHRRWNQSIDLKLRSKEPIKESSDIGIGQIGISSSSQSQSSPPIFAPSFSTTVTPVTLVSRTDSSITSCQSTNSILTAHSHSQIVNLGSKNNPSSGSMPTMVSIAQGKSRKELFLIFTRFLMQYLLHVHSDSDEIDNDNQQGQGNAPPGGGEKETLHTRAVAAIRFCADRHELHRRNVLKQQQARQQGQTQTPGTYMNIDQYAEFASLSASIHLRLRPLIGEKVWKNAQDYLQSYIMRQYTSGNGTFSLEDAKKQSEEMANLMANAMILKDSTRNTCPSTSIPTSSSVRTDSSTSTMSSMNADLDTSLVSTVPAPTPTMGTNIQSAANPMPSPHIISPVSMQPAPTFRATDALSIANHSSMEFNVPSSVVPMKTEGLNPHEGTGAQGNSTTKIETEQKVTSSTMATTYTPQDNTLPRCNNNASDTHSAPDPPLSAPVTLRVDSFRCLFLDHVKHIIATKEPGRESLYELLKMSNPTITMVDLFGEENQDSKGPSLHHPTPNLILRCSKPWLVLQSYLNPQQHVSNNDAGVLLRAVQGFYNQCLLVLDHLEHDDDICLSQIGIGANDNGDTDTPLENVYKTNSQPDQHEIKSDCSTEGGDNRLEERRIKKRKVCNSSPCSTNFPLDFHVGEKWPSLSSQNSTSGKVTSSSVTASGTSTTFTPRVIYEICESTVTPDELAAIVCYQCVNARGAIAHGACTELVYGTQNEPTRARTAEDAFRGLGGCKLLSASSDSGAGADVSTGACSLTMKEEIMLRGPIVSTSFLLPQNDEELNNATLSTSLNSNEKDTQKVEHMQEKWYLNRLKGKEHAVLIAGWKSTATGEAWIIQPLPRYCRVNLYTAVTGSSTELTKATETAENMVKSLTHTIPVTFKEMYIPFGQNGIENRCIVPFGGVDNVAWQKGPYLDIALNHIPGWRAQKIMAGMVSSQTLQKLGISLNDELLGNNNGVVKNDIIIPAVKTRVVIRDRFKIAKSRAGYLQEMKKQDNNWRIKVVFDDNSNGSALTE